MGKEKKILELERKLSELSLASKQQAQDLQNAKANAENLGKSIIGMGERLQAAFEEWQKEVTERLKKLEVAAGLAED